VIASGIEVGGGAIFESVGATGGLAALSADRGDLSCGSVVALVVLLVGVTECTDTADISSGGVVSGDINTTEVNTVGVLEPSTSASQVLFAAHFYSDNLNSRWLRFRLPLPVITHASTVFLFFEGAVELFVLTVVVGTIGCAVGVTGIRAGPAGHAVDGDIIRCNAATGNV